MHCLKPVIMTSLALLISMVAPAVQSADVTGTYVSEITTSSARVGLDRYLRDVEVTLRQEGDQITGVGSNNRLNIMGVRLGDRIEFHTVSGNEVIGHWIANADASRLEGKWFTHGAGGASGTWNLIRVE